MNSLPAARSIHAMHGLTAEQRERVGAYWWQRAQGEITSWVGFQHVLADLRAEHAVDSVLALAERAVGDELQHAQFCREWAMRFGHPAGDLVPRGERPIAFRGATEAENRLLRIVLCCMNETVGCVVLRHVRPMLVLPELRELNRRHMADELQHSRVGWGHLATLGDPQRERLHAWLPALLRLLKSTWCEGSELEHEELVPYGYFTRRLLTAAHHEAVSELILPGLDHLSPTKAIV